MRRERSKGNIIRVGHPPPPPLTHRDQGTRNKIMKKGNLKHSIQYIHTPIHYIGTLYTHVHNFTIQ